MNNNNNYIKYKLNPYWVTGLIDEEGCFSVSIYKLTYNNNYCSTL